MHLKSYTLEYKLKVVKYTLLNTVAITAKEFNIAKSNIYRWIKYKNSLLREVKTRGKLCRKLHKGRKTILSLEQENEIKHWFCKQRLQGNIVNMTHLIYHAKKIAEKHNIMFKASKSWISAFKKRLNIVIRKVTNVTSYYPTDFDTVADEFYNKCKRTLEFYEINNYGIINSDETAICLHTKSGYTLDFKGTKNINIAVANEFKKHVSLMLSVTADGRILQPMLIFKEYKGNMNKKVFSKLNTRGMLISASDSGWMKTQLYKRWLNKIIKPFVKENDNHKCLFVDLHASHTSTESVEEIKKIKKLEVMYIPAGCTGKLQPLDVLIFKPLKDTIRRKWIALTHKYPSKYLGSNYRQHIIDIVYYSIKEISTDLIKKSFIKAGIIDKNEE